MFFHSVFFECAACSDSDIQFIDESNFSFLEKRWNFHMENLRHEPGYTILSIKHPLSMPTILSDKINAFQKHFMVGNKNNFLESQWAAVSDINRFYIQDHKNNGEKTFNEFGELLEGRSSGHLKVIPVMLDCGVAISRSK